MDCDELNRLAVSGKLRIQIEPEPDLEVHLQDVFKRACQVGKLTSIGEQLVAVGKERFPDDTLMVPPLVLQMFVRRMVPKYPPLIVITAERFVSQLLYLFIKEADNEWELQYRKELINSTAWLVNLVLTTNDPARSVCANFPDLRETLLPVYRFFGPVTVGEQEWEMFRKSLTASVALKSSFLIVRGANGQPQAFPPVGNASLLPTEQFLPAGRRWKLAWDASFGLDDARTLATQILDNVIPFRGKGGRLIVAHCNDPNALPHLNAAHHVVANAQDKPLEEAVEDYLFAGKPKQRLIQKRSHFLKRLYSIGIRSTRRLAAALIEKGFVSKDSSDPQATAERIVRLQLREWRLEAGLLDGPNRNDE